MKTLIKLEELGQFILAIFFFNELPFSWWVFPACLFLPDLSMLGYLVNPKTGAGLYNLFHHKLLAIIIGIGGVWLANPEITLTGIILFGHSAMDRALGYGLKFNDHFKHTHLGWIGNRID